MRRAGSGTRGAALALAMLAGGFVCAAAHGLSHGGLWPTVFLLVGLACAGAAWWLLPRPAVAAPAQSGLAAPEQPTPRPLDTETLRHVARSLRSPMGAIMGPADLIRRHGVGPQSAMLVDSLIDAGEVLSLVIQDLLAQTENATAEVRIQAEPTELRSLCLRVAAMWRSQAEDKGLELFVDLPPQLPDWIMLDPLRTRQVLSHLIANAVQCTDSGGVRLSVQTSTGTTPDRVRVAMCVADTGRGLDQAELDRLLHGEDLAGESGRGLQVCRSLLGLMGGRIKGRSLPGQGTQIVVLLDVAKGKAPTLTPVVPIQAGLRVLVVEDNPANRRIASLFLDGVAEDVSLATDGVEALHLLNTQAFDLVLMDVRMPRMDGLEATRRLRASGGPNAGVPVVAFTADADGADLAACRMAGMNGFVAKPLRPSTLLTEIARVLAAVEPRAEQRLRA